MMVAAEEPQQSIAQEAGEPLLREPPSTLTSHKMASRFSLASRFASVLHSIQSTPYKALIGLGMVVIAAIVPLSNLKLAGPDRGEITNFRSAVTTPSTPSLPCNEPPPPSLPKRHPNHEYLDGTKYYGNFKHDIPADGRGIMLFHSGNRYDGEFKDGKRNGCGTLTFTNGKRYMGQFKDDYFHGKGVWTSKNGDRYIGAFKKNKCEGDGVLILADGTFQSGVWKDGKLADKNLSCN
jgi:hypothetical protein